MSIVSYAQKSNSKRYLVTPLGFSKVNFSKTEVTNRVKNIINFKKGRTATALAITAALIIVGGACIPNSKTSADEATVVTETTEETKAAETTKETTQIKETGKETEPEVPEENLPSYPAPDYDIAPGDAKYAMEFLGVPYVEGGEDENGFDNKGFVKYLYFQMFSSGFPDDYNELLYFGLKVSESKAQVSDIGCFSEGDNSELIAFCIGDGKAVYASPKEGKVVLKDISKMKVKSIRHLIDYYATSGNG